MPKNVSPRFLLSLVDLSRALKLAELAKALAVTKGFGVDLILNFISRVGLEKLDLGDLGLDDTHIKYLSNFCDSLGLLDSENFKLSALGEKILNLKNKEAKIAILMQLTLNWEPIKVLSEYLNVVKEATPDEIVEDLGWVMEKRTDELIKLRLISWQQKPFKKPFNPHIVNAIIIPWAVQLEIFHKDDKGKIRLIKPTENYRIHVVSSEKREKLT